MIEFASAFVWGAIQVALFALIVLAVVVAARKWVSGVVGELLFISMSLIILVPVIAMLPVPGWVPGKSTGNVASSSPIRSQDSPTSGSYPSINAAAEIVNLADGNQQPPDDVNIPEEVTTWSGTLSDWWTQFRSIPVIEVAPEVAASPPFPWPTLIFGALLSMSLIGLGRLLYGILALRSLKNRSREIFEPELLNIVKELSDQMKITKSIEVYETRELTTAATIGWRKPKILLPTDWQTWTEGEQASAVSHELAHVQSNDFIKNLIAQFAVALNFFNPLVHWLGQELRVSQELAADEKAAKATGGRTTYLLTMAEMALKQDTNQLGWLAQPFLPTRKTFLRRIEMLKSKRSLRGSRNGIALWATRTVVAAIALVCIGFRVPISELGAKDDSSKAAVSSTVTEINKLAYVSDRAQVFAAVDLDRLYEVDGFRELVMQLTGENNGGGSRFFVDLKEANLITAQVFDLEHGMISPNASMGLVIHFSEPLPTMDDESDKFVYRGNECFRMGGPCVFLPDDSTLVFGSDVAAMKNMLDAGMNGPTVSKWIAEADAHLAAPVTFAISQLGMEGLSEGISDPTTPFAPLWDDSTYCVGSLAIDTNSMVQLAANMAGKSERHAVRVAKAMNAWVLISQNTLSQLKTAIPGNAKNSKVAQVAIDSGNSILDSFQINQKAESISVAANCELHAETIGQILEYSTSNAVRAQAVSNSMNKIRQLTLAMHNWADAHRKGPNGPWNFPNSANSAKDSEHKHSWRIALLPYLEERELYDNYRFDEPWDSAHNREVTSKMPDCFRHPSQGPNETSSSYYMITGKGTVFPESGALRLETISDGTSNTIMLVEANRDTHWAKPDDIEFDEDSILNIIGGFEEGQATISLCDGSAHRFYKEKGKHILKSLILANDGIAPAWNER